MTPLPWYLYASFGTGFFLGIWLFWRATGYSRRFIMAMTAWLIVQSCLAVQGFYDDPRTMSYRFPILILPIVVLSLVARSGIGRDFMRTLDLGSLTLYHVIRVPVEITLSWLTMRRSLPHEIALWSGENFDILTGFSAPVMYHFVFVKKTLHLRWLRVWNIAGLILLTMPVVLALLSLPSRYRFFGFRRPDLAIGQFPFILLPAALVPLAYFAHFASLKKLRGEKWRHSQTGELV